MGTHTNSKGLTIDTSGMSHLGAKLLLGGNNGEDADLLLSTTGTGGLIIGAGGLAGTLSVKNATGTAVFNVGATGNTAVSGTLAVTGALSLGAVFTVDTSGNTALAGTLAVTGNTTLTGTLTINAGGNSILAATGAAGTAGTAIGILAGTGGAATTTGLAGGPLTLTSGAGSVGVGSVVSGAGGPLTLIGGAGFQASGVGGTGGAGASVSIYTGVAGAANGGTAGANGTLTVKAGGTGGVLSLFMDALGNVTTPVNPTLCFQRYHVLISALNTAYNGGTIQPYNLVPAVSGKQLRLWDFKMIPETGAVTSSTATGIGIYGVQSTSTVALASVAKAGLTQSAVCQINTAGTTILANGASFAPCDANTGIGVSAQAGSDLATSTNYVDFIVAYSYN